MEYEPFRRLVHNIRGDLETLAHYADLPKEVKRETWNMATRFNQLLDVAHKRSEQNEEGIQVWKKEE